METPIKKFNHIDMFKTADCTPHNNGQWIGAFEDEYHLEVKGDKARVFSNNPFNHRPSRWNKMRFIKKVKDSNKSIFQLTVNGCQAFFKIAHSI